MPLAVWVDRENVRDWLVFETEDILAQGFTADKEKAERWALARFDASFALKCALIPEQGAASPRPLRICALIGAALEAASLALLCWNPAPEPSPAWIALAMAAALIGSRTLLVAAAERILALRAQRTDTMIALIAALGLMGWAAYALLRYFPERRAQNRLIERLLYLT